MVCGFCGEDFKDSCERLRGGEKRITKGPKDHYGLPFQIKGKECPSCGKTMEYILTCTGNLYYKNEVIKDEKLLYSLNDYWKFIKENGLMNQFRKQIGEDRRERLNDGQMDIFPEDESPYEDPDDE